MESPEAMLKNWAVSRGKCVNKYNDVIGTLQSMGWQKNDPWLDKPSKTDPSYLIRLVMGTGSVVLIHRKSGIPDNVYNELCGNLKEIGYAITQTEEIDA